MGKRLNKVLLSLTMIFAMALVIMPVNVHAAEATSLFVTDGGTIEGVNVNEVIDEGIITNTQAFLNNGVQYGPSVFWRTWAVASGEIPPGTQLKGYTGYVALDGTPTTAGTYKFTLSVKSYATMNPQQEETFVTKEYQITVTAPKYDVTVNNGTTENTKYKKGDTVTITANAPATGKQFKEWTVIAGDVTLDNAKSATTKFTMPDKAVEVTATYEDIPHTHTPSDKWSSDTTTHWNECTAGDGEKMNQANHTYGEWVIDTQATGATAGSKHRDCTVCEHRETASIPATGVTPEKPTITTGAGSIHQISNSKDMTLTCSGKLEDLTGIYVDGKLVDESNYTLKSGSTILTLKASYLDTLSVGEHTLKFQYKDNVSAETNFTIAKVAETPKTDTVIKDTSSPKTGDTTATSLYIGLLALSGCAVAFVFRRRKATNK